MPLPNQIFPVERDIAQFQGTEMTIQQMLCILAGQLKMIHDKQNEIIQQVNAHSELLMQEKMTPTETELREMMRDPKYWRDQDPETVRKIEQGFKKLYGGTNENN